MSCCVKGVSDKPAGVVQVGGDGLFQEIMNGLLELRSQGGQMAALAGGMRLGHIPAGSTDAVAYSIHGTRSQLTAALHIALGDRSALVQNTLIVSWHLTRG